MPYARNTDLPANVKGLPSEAKSVWRSAFNAAYDEYKGDEERSFRVAWAAVKNAGWKKNKDDEWVKSEKSKWGTDVPIAKVDDDKRLVFGWLSVAKTADGSVVIDHHGDVIDVETLENAAYNFVLDARNVGEMHTRIQGIGRVVESAMITKEKMVAMGIPEGSCPEGWWFGVKVDNDEVWPLIKNGTYRAFSIGGKARPEKINV